MLAIDPGTTESAFVAYVPSSGIIAHGKMPNAELLELLPSLRAKGGPDVAVEMIASYGMAVGREVFETCLWVGRFIERLQPAPVRLIYRLQVKSHLCHSQKAKDANIRQALIDKLGPPGTKKKPGPTYGISGDTWAALAVAVTACETSPAAESIRGIVLSDPGPLGPEE
jgi:hypothetical protein